MTARVPGTSFCSTKRQRREQLHDRIVYESYRGSSWDLWMMHADGSNQANWTDAAHFCNERSRAEGLQPCYDEKTCLASDALGFRCACKAPPVSGAKPAIVSAAPRGDR